MTQTAWGFVRLSGTDQGSIQKQKSQIRDYAADRPQIELARVINEGEKSSGFDRRSERPELDELFRAIENNRIDIIIVRDMARISRHFDDRTKLIIACREHNVEIHVTEINGKIDIEDPTQAALEAVSASMDHTKKKAEIERSREATRELVESDRWHGAPPYGFHVGEDGYLVPGDDFDRAIEAVRLGERDESIRSISQATGIARSTVSNILDRKEWYLAAEKGVPIGSEGPLESSST